MIDDVSLEKVGHMLACKQRLQRAVPVPCNVIKFKRSPAAQKLRRCPDVHGDEPGMGVSENGVCRNPLLHHPIEEYATTIPVLIVYFYHR